MVRQSLERCCQSAVQLLIDVTQAALLTMKQGKQGGKKENQRGTDPDNARVTEQR
jgi:hypothetical protein